MDRRFGMDRRPGYGAPQNVSSEGDADTPGEIFRLEALEGRIGPAYQ
jgi:hypothetical protein